MYVRCVNCPSVNEALHKDVIGFLQECHIEVQPKICPSQFHNERKLLHTNIPLIHPC